MKAIPVVAVFLSAAAAVGTARAAETIALRPGVTIVPPPAEKTRNLRVIDAARGPSVTAAADPRVHVAAPEDGVDGQVVRYSLYMSNDGDTDLPGPIVVGFEAAQAFAAASFSGNGWTCSFATQTCEWPADVAAGGSTSSAVFDVTAAAPYGGSGACDRSPCLFLHAAVNGYPDSAGGGFTAIVVDGHAPPIARDDIAYMPATPVTISIVPLDNDTFQTAMIDVAAPPAHGVATVNTSGMTLEYTPDATFAGTDSLRYTLTDFLGATATATVRIGPLTGGIAFQLPLIDIGQVEVGRVAMRLGWIDNTTGVLLQGTAAVEPVDPADIPAILAGTGYDPAMAVFDPAVLKPQDGQFVNVYPTNALVDAMVRPRGPVGTVFIARVRLAASPYLNPQVSVTAETVIVARADDGTHTPVHARDDAQLLPPDTPTVVFPLSNDEGTQGGTITVSALGIQDPFDGTITFDLGALELTETNFPFTGIRVIPFPGATGTGTFTYATSELVGGTYDRYDFAAFTVTLGTPPPPPVAVASGSASICAGGSTDLSGSGGVSCSWLPTTGLSDAASCMPSASPASTTTYTLTVVDAFGQSSTNNPTVTVTVNALPVAAASGSTTIPLGGSAPLSGSGGASCAWSPALGLSNPASCAPTATPTLTTTYSLVVTSAAGCASTNAASATITVVGAGTSDLVIQDFAAQNQVREGNAMGVGIRTRNVAAGLATASITRLYLSTDPVADPGDISIRDTAVGALQANEEHYTAFVITLPIVPLGQYYLLAVADAANSVPEADESNNTRYARIHIKRAQ